MELLQSNATIFNSTNATNWLTREEVEHFLGDPDVLHALALGLGLAAIMQPGKKLPHILASVAAISFGLWVALVVQDRQTFNEPLWGSVILPDGIWVPILAGLTGAAAAIALSFFAWKLALVLLTSGLLMMIALAICRLFEVSPERAFQIGASLLSAYRITGAVILVAAILVSVVLVRKFHKHMVSFASATLGTLLLLSGVSYFCQREGVEAPFSLLDDLARIISEVRGGRCQLWEPPEGEGNAPAVEPLVEAPPADGDDGLKGCDCEGQCQAEILAWLASTVTVIVGRWLLRRQHKGWGKVPNKEENVGLKSAQDVKDCTHDDIDVEFPHFANYPKVIGKSDAI